VVTVLQKPEEEENKWPRRWP